MHNENASVKVMIEVHNQSELTVMMVYVFNEVDRIHNFRDTVQNSAYTRKLAKMERK